MKKLYLSIFLASLSILTFAQEQISFYESSGPPGGKILKLYPVQDYAIALASPNDDDMGDLYFRSEGFDQWQRIMFMNNEGQVQNEGTMIDFAADDEFGWYAFSQTRCYRTVGGSPEEWHESIDYNNFVMPAGAQIVIAGLPKRLYANTGTELWVSEDGETWTEVDTGLGGDETLLDFAIFEQHIYLAVSNGSDGEIKYSDDGGNSFSTVNSGLPDATLVEIEYANDSIYALFANGTQNGGIYGIEIGGSTWTQNATAADLSPVGLNSDDASRLGLYTSWSEPTTLYVTGNGQVVKKTEPITGDWAMFNNFYYSDQITAFVSFDSDVCIAGYSSVGVYATFDGGATAWEFFSQGISHGYTSDFVKSGNNYLALNGRNRVLHALYANNWDVKNACNNCNLSKFYELSSTSLLAIGSEVWRSDDNGDTWTGVSTITDGDLRSVTGLADNSKIWGVLYNRNTSTEKEIYLSEDEGVTWNIQNFTGIPSDIRVEAIHANADGDLFIYTRLNNSPYTSTIYRVNSGSLAATPVAITGMTRMKYLRADGDLVYIVAEDNEGESYLLYSEDGGATWTVRQIDHVAFKEGNRFYVYNKDIIFIGNEHGANRVQNFYYTSDGGNNINAAFKGYKYHSLNKVFVNENGIAYVIRSLGPMMTSNLSVIRPSEPENFRVIANASNEVHLQWEQPGEEVNRFALERRDPSDVNFKVIEADLTDNSGRRYFIDDSELDPETVYTYRVKAQNSAGVTISQELNVTTKELCTSSTIPDNRSWTGVVTGGNTNGNINIRKLADGAYSISDLTAGSVQPETDASTIPGKFYQNCEEPYIQPDGGTLIPNGNGSWDGTTLVINWQLDLNNPQQNYDLTAKTITLTLNSTDPGPEVPSNVFAFVYDDSSIELRWNPGQYQHKYIIERASAVAGPYTKIGEVLYPTTSYRDEGLTSGTTYHYQIKAENNNSTPLVSGYCPAISVVLSKPNFVLANTTLNDMQVDALAATWVDLNADGNDDLIASDLALSGGPYNKTPRIFQNDGAGNFAEVVGMFPTLSYPGAIPGDYNNDGLADLFLSFGTAGDSAVTGTSLLYKNNGNFDLSNVPSSALNNPVQGSAASANWIDYNKDGYLDLFVSYGNGKQKLFNGQANGTFEKVYEGDNIILYPDLSIQAAIWFDYDFDNDQDVFICVAGGNNNNPENPEEMFVNDNRLYENVGGEYIRKTGTGLADYVGPIGTENADDLTSGIKFSTACAADYNNDGLLDIYVCSNNSANLLFKNLGNGEFERQPAIANSPTESKTSGSYGASWGDVDNDGDLDLIVTNSFKAARLYLNDGDETFTKAGDELLNKYIPSFSAGVAFSDYDNDGRLDVFYPENTSLAGTPGLPQPKMKLLRNNNQGGNYLSVQLVGMITNKSAYGAKVQIFYGDNSQLREVMSTGALGSHNSQTLHFGLGSTAVIDSILVVWPMSSAQKMYSVAANQRLVIYEDNEGPTIQSVSPADEAENVPLASAIEITFGEVPYPVNGKYITVYKVTDSGNVQVAQILVTDGVVIDSTIAFTISGGLESLTEYHVTLDDGSFTDVYSNAITNTNYNWQFTTIDGVAPTVSYDETVFAEVGVGFASEDIFVEADDNVAVTSVVMYYRSVGATDYLQLTNTLAVNVDEYHFTVLETFFNGVGIQYYFVASDGSGNTTRLPATSDTFYERTFELETPFITYDESTFPEVSVGFADLEISVTVTDNLGVENVTMHHRAIGDTEFIALAGVQQSNPETWKFVVKNSFFSASGMEYYFEATDATGNTGRYPLAANSQLTKTYENVAPVIAFSATAMMNKGLGVYTFVPQVEDNFGVASVTMHYKHLSGTEFNVAGDPSISGTSYTFSIPESEFVGEGIRYYYEAADATGNTSRLPASSTEFFTTSLDNEAPVVDFHAENFDQFTIDNTSITYTAAVTDNMAVDEVKLFYRLLSEKTFKSKTASVLTNDEATFTITKDAQDFDNTGTAIEYYWEATDVSGNLQQLKNGADNFITQFEFPDNTASIAVVKSEGKVNGYQIIAIPYVMNDRSIASNFGELGAADKTKYRFLHYSVGPPERWEEYPGNLTEFNRGKGYFINSRDGITIQFTKAFAPSETQLNPFKMNLVAGWNQIGNPYLTRVEWDDVVAANPGTGDLIVFTDGGYGVSEGLDRFTGGFVFSENAIADFIIPISTTGGRKKNKVFQKDLASDMWKLPIKVSQGKYSHELTAIGMAWDASPSFDKYDLVVPPRFFDYLELTTAHPEHISKRLAADVVPTQDEFVWEFNVEAEHTDMATLSWDNTAFGDNNKELYLLDEAEQIVVNMREQSTYHFSPIHSGRMKIFFGENLADRVVPSGLRLGKAHPNPTKGVTNIGFTLPETGHNYHVVLEVFDLLGRRVATIADGTFAPGYHQAQWDTREDNLTNGFYTYRIVADTNSKKEVRSGKVLLNK